MQNPFADIPMRQFDIVRVEGYDDPHECGQDVVGFTEAAAVWSRKSFHLVEQGSMPLLVL